MLNHNASKSKFYIKLMNKIFLLYNARTKVVDEGRSLQV
jgi:hypothetical protein